MIGNNVLLPMQNTSLLRHRRLSIFPNAAGATGESHYCKSRNTCRHRNL